MSSDQNRLSEPPFVTVEGLFNTRAVGGYSVPSDPQSVVRVKPAILYRSGDPSRITEKGKEQLLSLGIRRAFDFRNDSEIAGYGSKVLEIPNVEVTKAPVSRDHDKSLDPATLIKQLMSQFETNEIQAFMRIYTEILELGGPAFEKILRHMIEKPDEPRLVHCTAGKDRTGVFVALVLMILGVNDQDIIDDYSLTTIGLEPVIPLIKERAGKLNKAYQENPIAAQKMGSSRPETMAATLHMIRQKYGGAEEYLKSHTSLNDSDIRQLRENFVLRTA
ncbi:hypothetical protein E1B28_010354 [Marasmius oreades]|uniref:Tyrosine specific protein phosphatases domain-containing protein n=1 Tax=Marasmius oreades TaxID=181124 RepID=A0A9P7URE0_9AGAR|nr:uncharacterized protein E1B28_010354 [Marasmius oreades]KAG7091308.1 hypothetical protein E1B28_010354 [Marasmius oreades]